MSTRLKRLVVDNICNIEHKEIEFQVGLIGILGPNGSGKSTTLNSIYAALTNDFSWHDENKAGVPRMGSTGESRILLELETDQGVATITRTLGDKAESLMVLPDGRSSDAVATISQWVGELLKTTPSVLRNFVFVPQWELFNFLTASPTVRMEFLSAICDTQRMEACWKQAGEILSADQKLDQTPTLKGRLSGIRESIERTKGELVATEQQIDNLRINLIRPDLLEHHQQIVRAHERAEEAGRDIARAQPVIRELETKIQTGAERLEKSQRSLAATQQAIRKADQELQSHEVNKERLGGLALKEVERRGVAKEKIRLEAAIQENVRKARELEQQLKIDKTKLATPEVRDQLRSRRDELRRHIRLINEGKSECGHCGQHLEIDLPAERIENLRAQLRTTERLVADDESATLKVQRNTSRLQDVTTAEARDHVLLQDVERQLAAMPEANPQVEQQWNEAKSGWQAARDRLSDLRETVPGLQTAVQNLDRQLISDRAMLETHQRRVDELKKVLEKRPRPQDVETSREAIREHEATAQQIKSLDAVADLQRKNIRGFQEDRRKTEQDLESMKPIRAWIDRLHGIRGEFHREALQKSAVSDTLNGLLKDVNHTLQQFGAPFTAVVDDEELKFKGRFPYGDVGARSLSGAQKVMLSLAIRMSVGFGFLALDEPTAGLDQQALSLIIQSIYRMRERIRNAGAQVIIVTHEPALVRVVDQEIRLA